MDIQSLKKMNIDSYDEKYIVVNAKQYDDKTRYILFSCYDQGTKLNISSSEQRAYVRYKKADGYTVSNICEITGDGNILVELTQQMLAAAGMCKSDLLIVNESDNSYLSSMIFYVNVIEDPINNAAIDSGYEYIGLADIDDVTEKIDENTQSIFDHIADHNNPHHVTKEQLGLGNVQNSEPSDMEITFTQASTRTNITSGSTLSNLFGKIKKWFADLKTVAFSGSYNDLSDTPTIPTVNNGTLTLTSDGSTLGTFSANQSTNRTINIPCGNNITVDSIPTRNSTNPVKSGGVWTQIPTALYEISATGWFRVARLAYEYIGRFYIINSGQYNIIMDISVKSGVPFISVFSENSASEGGAIETKIRVNKLSDSESYLELMSNTSETHKFSVKNVGRQITLTGTNDGFVLYENYTPSNTTGVVIPIKYSNYTRWSST